MKKYQYEQQHKEEITITCSSEISLGKALHYEAEMLDWNCRVTGNRGWCLWWLSPTLKGKKNEKPESVLSVVSKDSETLWNETVSLSCLYNNYI